MHESILNDIRVLDFTRVLAGPYATRILADFGAEVIKVQTEKTATGTETNDSAYFHTWNRNKRSITLDLSRPQGRDVARSLVKISDIVVENFSPRVMENWGLTYDDLMKVKPDIIMVRLAAMGQTGPWRDCVAFAPTIQSLAGLTHLTSYAPGDPQGIGFSYSDIVSGLYGAVAVLAALEYRDHTGKGQQIDMSQYEAACTLIGPTLAQISESAIDLAPCSNQNEYGEAVPYGCYPCLGEDRWCVLAVYNQDQWRAMEDIMGRPQWFNNQKFTTPAARKANVKELDALIGQWTSKYPAEQIARRFQQRGVPAGIVQDAAELANDAQLADRNYFVPLQHPILGNTVSDGWPIMGDDDLRLRKNWRAAPLLGEANDYVFLNLLKMTADEKEELIRSGVIG